MGGGGKRDAAKYIVSIVHRLSAATPVRLVHKDRHVHMRSGAEATRD